MPGPTREPNISLTLVGAPEGDPSCTIRILTAQLITYSQRDNFTQLTLTGGRVLEVKESTDQIDRLVRIATANLARQ
ncbi:MAG: hypothetical protein ABSA69_04695 [Verrucomicrobiota bacterium]